MDEITTEQWEQAKLHFDNVLQGYRDIAGLPGVNVTFSLTVVFQPLLKRYSSGERTPELYQEMMAVQ